MNRDEWILAGDLEVGDRLMLSGGEEAELIETMRYPANTKVYNLDVAGYETYFANGVLVYQDCGGQTAERVDDHLRAYLQDRRPAGHSHLLRSSKTLTFIPDAMEKRPKAQPPVELNGKGGRP